jgi:HK97 family phage major capsid protein
MHRTPRPGEIIGYRKDGRPIRLQAGGSANPYLDAQREKYENLRTTIAGIQTRAREAGRDLTPDELRSIGNMNDSAAALDNEIKLLSAVELRNAEQRRLHAEVTAAMNGGDGGSIGNGPDDTDNTAGAGAGAGDITPVGQQQNRAAILAGTRAVDRDPGFYLRSRGQNSFLADVWLSQTQRDETAAARLTQHNRSARAWLDTPDGMELRDVLGAGATTNGAGLIPPVWLAAQFAPILHKRLRVATLLRNIPWAGPFAWTIPVATTAAQTTSTAEGVNTTETDPGYSTVTVTPKAISGYSEISRQMLEASNPAVDSIVWGDMVGNFYDNVEADVIAHLSGLAGVNTVTVSAGAATTADIMAQRAGILNAIAAVSDNNAGDATFFAGRNSRWITYLLMADSTGRPLITAQRYNPNNAIGLGQELGGMRRVIVGELEALDVATSPTIAASTGFVVNGDEVLFSVSAPMQFRFDEPAGPALVRIGIWGYEAVSGARRPKAVTKITYSGS